MPAAKLKDFLNRNKIRYVTISHSPAYTAQEVAHSAHISGKEVAKTVILKVDGKLAMAVLPAHAKVDLGAVRKAVGAKDARLAEEDEFKDAFPGCELGAMPPFGNLWNVPVYVAQALEEDEQIAFNSGSHTELVQMRYDDFKRLVQPEVLKLSHALV